MTWPAARSGSCRSGSRRGRARGSTGSGSRRAPTRRPRRRRGRRRAAISEYTPCQWSTVSLEVCGHGGRLRRAPGVDGVDARRGRRTKSVAMPRSPSQSSSSACAVAPAPDVDGACPATRSMTKNGPPNGVSSDGSKPWTSGVGRSVSSAARTCGTPGPGRCRASSPAGARARCTRARRRRRGRRVPRRSGATSRPRAARGSSRGAGAAAPAARIVSSSASAFAASTPCAPPVVSPRGSADLAVDHLAQRAVDAACGGRRRTAGRSAARPARRRSPGSRAPIALERGLGDGGPVVAGRAPRAALRASLAAAPARRRCSAASRRVTL